MEIVSAGSSSSGNSYIIRAAGRDIILDAGLSCKKILEALDATGTAPGDVAAVLITHEHIDHVKSVRALSRKCCNAIFYASRGTIESAAAFSYVPPERLRSISAGESFIIDSEDSAMCHMSEHSDHYNNIKVAAFALSHDAAEPISYTIEADGEKLAVVTDTGIVTDEIYESVKDADMLVFEANHDEHMLMFGEYPYPVKMRIKGDKGHLSNDAAAETLVRILTERAECGSKENGRTQQNCSSASRNLHPRFASGKSGIGHSMTLPALPLGNRQDMSRSAPGENFAMRCGLLHIMLAHLSFHNNIPLFARQTVEDRLASAGFHKGIDYTLEVAKKEGLTYLQHA